MKVVHHVKKRVKNGDVPLIKTKRDVVLLFTLSVFVFSVALASLCYVTTRHLTPASNFYSVKQYFQQKRIFLTRSPEAKAKVYMIQTSENLNELESLIKDNYQKPVPYVISADLFASHQHSTGGQLRILKAQGVDIKPLVNEFCETLNGYTTRFDATKASSPKASQEALIHAQKMTIDNIHSASEW